MEEERRFVGLQQGLEEQTERDDALGVRRQSVQLVEEAGVDGSEDEVEGTRVVVDVAEGSRVHGKAVERHHAVGRIEHLPND